ncbi:MAG: hypothetical protein QOF20_3037 [Acidimicrobiaceae bacterium]|nr:hypothetical protein [Acidimicrobiaceae bacterium]
MSAGRFGQAPRSECVGRERLYGGIGAGALLGIAVTGIMCSSLGTAPSCPRTPMSRSPTPAAHLGVGLPRNHDREACGGQLAIGSLDAEPPDNPWSVRIRLENRTIELVATTPSRDGSTCAPPNRSSPHSPPSGFASESPRAPAPAGVAMAFKLIESTQTRWRAVSAPLLVALVRAGAVSRTPSSSNDPTSQRAVISKSRHADPLTHRPPCPPSRVQSPGIRVSAAADTGPIVI